MAVTSTPVTSQAVPVPSGDELPWPPVATFSIVGYDPVTEEVGVAVQSRVFSVGNGVIWGKAGVGVVATQAIVDVSYGPQGLALLGEGYSPSEAVQEILRRDPDPAAMPIVKEDGGVWLNNDVGLRLQVDDHDQPIAELRRLVEKAGEQRDRRRNR